MISRDAVVAEARTWAGTPYVHQGRVRGAGVDCVGLVIGVAHALGISTFDTSDYLQQPDPIRMGRLLREHLEVIDIGELARGDIVWVHVADARLAPDPQHLAIITETAPRMMMIHALRRTIKRTDENRVVEHGLDRVWHQRIAGCFRYRGVG